MFQKIEFGASFGNGGLFRGRSRKYGTNQATMRKLSYGIGVSCSCYQTPIFAEVKRSLILDLTLTFKVGLC